MKKIEIIIRIISGLYLNARRKVSLSHYSSTKINLSDTLTRQQVKEYLNISESTYKRKVKDGTLKPMRLPGGDRYYKADLLEQWKESRRRGRT